MSEGGTRYSVVKHFEEDMTRATVIKKGYYMTDYVRNRREGRSYYLSGSAKDRREGYFVSGSVKDRRERYALEKRGMKQSIEKQPNVETSTFGAKSYAKKIAREMTEALHYKLCMFDIPVDNGANNNT